MRRTRDFRALDVPALTARLEQLRQEYASAHEAVRAGKEKNHARLALLRRDIARAQTVLREKQP